MVRRSGVEIEIFRNALGLVVGFSAKGHAGTAKHGKDIVCAAISALTQTTALGLVKHLNREIDLQHASGDMVVRLKAKPDALTNTVFETMILGLNEIEKINPQSVHILDAQEVK
ncbi:ribosomal-processing cysteine protease Prp [Anaerosinus sp.]|uniref:ribosomal-processing cysteine protease Prp n=1 Tax=Selenobaculum sp. TaxID=3074374 RepID=UPI003AB66DF0